MAAYIIADIDVTEPLEYEEYKRLAGSTPEKFGGRYIVRGAPVELLEGEWTPKRFVVLEFPSLEQAKAWYHSEEYGIAKAIRHRTAKSHVILVDGVRPA